MLIWAIRSQRIWSAVNSLKSYDARKSHLINQSINLLITRRWATTVHVPGPKAYPIIGCLPAIISDKEFDKKKTYLYFQKLFRIYGPIVKIQFPMNPPMILIQRPEDVRTLLNMTQKNPFRGGMLSLKKARYSNPYYEKKGGIVVENGDEWWRVRSKVQVPIMKLKNIYPYIKDMDQITLDLLKRVSEHRDATGQVTLNFLEELQKWSVEIMCLVSLNQRIGCFDDERNINTHKESIRTAAYDLINSITTCEVGSQLWKLYRTKPFRQLERSLNLLTSICDKVLQETESKLANRKDNEFGDDLNLQDHLLLSGKGLTRRDIVTFMLDIIPGGSQTVSDNAAVIIYQLAKNPEAQKKLQEELDRVFGDGTAPITAKHLAELSYTRAVIKETNRVMPPLIGPMRILQNDLEFESYTLKKGWTILCMNNLLGWDESTFPQVDKFLPERWLREKPLGYIHPLTNMPFSHGKRMCIGRRLAEQMLYIILSRIFHRYYLEWKHEDLIRELQLVFRPKGTMKFTFTER